MKNLTFLFSLLLLSSCVSKEMQPDEKALLFTRADAISEYDFNLSDNDQPVENFSKSVYFDGSKELEYEYESKEEDPEFLYIYNSVSLERKESDANITYGAIGLGMKWGQEDGVTFRSLDHEFSFGEKSSVKLVRNQGMNVGNVFTIKKGKLVYFLAVYGIYAEDRVALEGLVLDKLEALDAKANRG